MKRLLYWFAALAGFALLTAACGGGGGDGGSAPKAAITAVPWSAAQAVGAETIFAMSPQVAMDTSGNAIAVWQQHDDDRNSIRANRYDAASGTWGTAEVFEAFAIEAAAPKVTIAPNGNAVVIWLHHDGTRYQMWVKRYDAATAEWSDAQVVDTGSSTSSLGARADIDDGGNVVVVWYQQDGARYSIRAARYSPASGWRASVPIDDGSGVAIYPHVAFDGNGNITVVWYQEDGTRNNIWVNRYNGVTGWVGATMIESTSMDAVAPQVAMSANGDGMAIWYGWDGDHYVLWSGRFDGATNQWDEAEVIEAANAGAAIDAQLSMADDGSALATWQTNDGSRRTIWTKHYSATSGWGESNALAAVDAQFAERPQLSVSRNGTLMAVWAQSDGTWNRVWANQLN